MPLIQELHPINDPDAARELHDFARRLGESISVELTSCLDEAGTASSKPLAQTISEVVPLLLEKHMLRGLMVDGQAAKTRAHLAHALSALTLQGFEENMEAPRTLDSVVSQDAPGDLLTSAEAARLLNVSRTYLNTLIAAGKLGFVERTEGGHRRIGRSALFAYRAATRQQQADAITEMTAASDELGMYDDELKSIPRPKAR